MKRTNPTRLVKRLVAVVDQQTGDGLDEHPQEPYDLPGAWALPPQDGDLVGIPTPCARLRAGYWCTCGGSFKAIRNGVPMTRARVALVDLAADEVEGVPFVDGPSGQADVPVPDASERDALDTLLEALAVGTVVERNGVGFAPLYRPSSSDRSSMTVGSW